MGEESEFHFIKGKGSTMTRRRLLHVDEDVSCLDRIQSELGRYGIEVESLTDATRCISRLEARNHRVLLLTESAIPEPSFSLLRDIKHRDGSIEVLLLTPPQPTTAVLKAFRLGAYQYFFKPLNEIDPLIVALEAVYAKIDRQWAMVLQTTRDLVDREPTPWKGDSPHPGDFWLTADEPAAPQTRPEGRDRRSEPRAELQTDAWVVPMRGGEPCLDAAFSVVTQDLSTRGLGLVSMQSVTDDELLVCLTSLDPERAFHVEVRSNTRLTNGSHRLGVQVREILDVRDIAGLEELLARNLHDAAGIAVGP